MIDKKHDRDTHDNAARLVIEILRVSRDSQYAPASDRFDDPLLNTLESAETVQLLLKIIFGRPVSTLKLPNVCRNSQALTTLLKLRLCTTRFYRKIFLNFLLWVCYWKNVTVCALLRNMIISNTRPKAKFK